MRCHFGAAAASEVLSHTEQTVWNEIQCVQENYSGAFMNFMNFLHQSGMLRDQDTLKDLQKSSAFRALASPVDLSRTMKALDVMNTANDYVMGAVRCSSDATARGIRMAVGRYCTEVINQIIKSGEQSFRSQAVSEPYIPSSLFSGRFMNSVTALAGECQRHEALQKCF